jgi:O-antigen/teichoic acid export membrane protein
MLFWAAASLLDLLPTIDERVIWQAKITISLSVLRAITLGAAAYLSGDLGVLVWVMVGFALVKFLILLGYVAVTQGFAGPWVRRGSFTEQLRYAVPFGISDTLYGLRGQADQWVAATLFSLQNFAAFSIAGVLGPLVNLFRVSVNHVFLPSMSRLQAANDVQGMLDLNSRANIMVAALVYPMLAFAFVYTEILLTLVYTAAYVEAVPVMRVYIISLAVLVVELASLTLLLREGTFVLRLNLMVVVLSIVVSWFGAQQFGLAGAALGSVLAILLDRFATLRRLQMRTAIPFGQLQDWSSLGLLMLFSSLAALLSWVVTGNYFSGSALFLQLLIGGTVMVVAYAVMTAAHGIGRGWLSAAYNFRS